MTPVKYPIEIIHRAKTIKSRYRFGYKTIAHMLNCEFSLTLPPTTVRRWVDPDYRKMLIQSDKAKNRRNPHIKAMPANQ